MDATEAAEDTRDRTDCEVRDDARELTRELTRELAREAGGGGGGGGRRGERGSVAGSILAPLSARSWVMFCIIGPRFWRKGRAERKVSTSSVESCLDFGLDGFFAFLAAGGLSSVSRMVPRLG